MVVNLCGWSCLFVEAELTRLTSEIAAVLWVGNKSVTVQACGSDRDISVFVGEHLTLKQLYKHVAVIEISVCLLVNT